MWRCSSPRSSTSVRRCGPTAIVCPPHARPNARSVCYRWPARDPPRTDSRRRGTQRLPRIVGYERAKEMQAVRWVKPTTIGCRTRGVVRFHQITVCIGRLFQAAEWRNRLRARPATNAEAVRPVVGSLDVGEPGLFKPAPYLLFGVSPRIPRRELVDQGLHLLPPGE